MFISSLGLGLGLVALSGTVQAVEAQAAVAFHQDAGSTSSAIVRQQDKQPLEQKLSLQLERVTLAAALQEIASQMGLTATFGPVVANDTRRVSVVGKNMLASAALNQAISGKGIQYSISGSLLVFERKQETAQAQGTIVGRVLNAKTKQPVAGAVVSASGGAVSVKTGDDGRFRILVPVGEHELQVRAVGFVRQAKRVTVGSEDALVVEIVLEPAASVLDEVIVTGTVVATERKAIPNPITVITAEDIEKRGITRIEELMRGDIPGVLALDEGSWTTTDLDDNLGGMVSSKVYSRGASGLERPGGVTTPLKTFIDGVELLDASYLGTIDPRSIERIEVITGPQAATIYGAGAMGGVMQIFTKKGTAGRPMEATFAFRYGTIESNLSNSLTPVHHTTLGVTGGLGPQLSYSATISHDYSGQWQPGLFSRRIGVAAGATSQKDRLTITGSVATTSSHSGTSAYVTGGMVGVLKRQVGEWVPTAAHNVSGRISNTSNQTLGVSFDYRFRPSWHHRLTVGRSQNNFVMTPEVPKFTRPSDTLFKQNESHGQRTNWSYSTTQISQLKWWSSSLTLGASGSVANQSRVIGCTATRDATSLIACGTRASSALSVNRTIRDSGWGGFGTWRVGFFEQLYLTLGLRGEKNPNYGEAHKIDWTPTNGVAYTISYRDVSLKLLASYGSATRTPPEDARREIFRVNSNFEPSILLDRIANQNIHPEYSRGPQGGIELYLGNVASLMINHYQQKVTDLLMDVLVDSVPFTFVGQTDTMWSGVSQWQNVARIRQVGWEGSGSINLLGFTIQGTYSWNDSRVLSVIENGAPGTRTWYPGQSFIGVPSHTGSVRVSYATGNTSVSVNTSVIGRSLISGTTRYGNDYWTFMRNYSRIQVYLPVGDWGGSGNLIHGKPGYVRSNAALSHRITPWAALTVNIVNLGNRFATDGSEAAPGYPTMGRRTTFGVSLRR